MTNYSINDDMWVAYDILSRMASFEILPHMADAAIRAHGADKKDLVIAALRGLFEIASPQKGEKAEQVTRPFKIIGSDFNEVFINILNEAITNSDIYRETYQTINFKTFSDTEAQGEFVGQTVEGFDKAVKGATYHGLEIRQPDKNRWDATIIFDV